MANRKPRKQIKSGELIPSKKGDVELPIKGEFRALPRRYPAQMGLHLVRHEAELIAFASELVTSVRECPHDWQYSYIPIPKIDLEQTMPSMYDFIEDQVNECCSSYVSGGIRQYYAHTRSGTSFTPEGIIFTMGGHQFWNERLQPIFAPLFANLAPDDLEESTARLKTIRDGFWAK